VRGRADLRAVTLESLRAQIASCRRTHRSPATVRENLRYGKSWTPASRVVAAARSANADEFIALPQAITRVGEKGVKLSGGQRSAWPLPAAILKDPRILLPG